MFGGKWGERPGMGSQRGCEDAGAAGGMPEKLGLSEINPGTVLHGGW